MREHGPVVGDLAWVSVDPVQVLALSNTFFMTLGKALTFSVLQFPISKMGITTLPYMTRGIVRINTLALLW